MFNGHTTAVLTATGLAIGYRQGRGKQVIVAENINLNLERGELVCLLGPNGAGKSTLLRTLTGMQPPLAGDIQLMGLPPAKLKPAELAKKLAVVLTERLEVGALPVNALVALGRHPYTGWTGKLTAHDQQIVSWALEMTAATHLAHRPFSEISDGERQKVLIARALAQEPELIVLDEPTAFLDLPRRAEIMHTLRRLANETGRAVLLSTHDLDLALRSADRVWLLPLNETLQVGAPEDLVLNGAFEKAFGSAGVEFDRQVGSFRVSSPVIAQVDFAGEGLTATWTVRALERAGYRLTPEGCCSEVLVEVLGEGEWRSTINGVALNHASIYSLLSHLQSYSKLASSAA